MADRDQSERSTPELPDWFFAKSPLTMDPLRGPDEHYRAGARDMLTVIEAESPKRLWHRDRYQALDGAARTMVAVATATYHGPDAGYRRVAAMNVAVTRLQEALDA